ncbi:MAG: alkaline phosphatase family protein [Acidobacteriota bacterium]|nr:alkaline phosphatase family protein [Acidobacteriota bacterium]
MKALSALLAAVCLACLPGFSVAGSASTEPQTEKRPKVLFVGVDGASWKVIGPLLKSGQLPALARLHRQGAHAPDFDTLEEAVASPLIWTTIATGRTPADHGIESFVTPLPNGAMVPVTSSSRKARAIWEIANRNGMTAGIIGYWASWPAERIRGYVITDHANAAFSEFLVRDGRLWRGADPAFLSRLRRDFYPPDIGATLAKHWITREDFPYQDLQDRAGYSPEQTEQLGKAPWNVFGDYYSLLKTMYRVDFPLFLIAQDLISSRPTDLVMLYLHGPDPIQHVAWDLAEPGAFEEPNANLERDRGLVEGVYRAVDSMLGELLEDIDENTWVMVASDHGVQASTADRSRPGEHPYSAKGVLFLDGPHVKPGYRIKGATPYDLMPTLAWLLDIPLSEELEGRILTDAFEAEFVSARPVTKVASYGARETSTPQKSEGDKLMLDLLNALGYIEN